MQHSLRKWKIIICASPLCDFTHDEEIKRTNSYKLTEKMGLAGKQTEELRNIKFQEAFLRWDLLRMSLEF